MLYLFGVYKYCTTGGISLTLKVITLLVQQEKQMTNSATDNKGPSIVLRGEVAN